MLPPRADLAVRFKVLAIIDPVWVEYDDVWNSAHDSCNKRKGWLPTVERQKFYKILQHLKKIERVSQNVD